MIQKLVVTRSFETFTRGDIVTDPGKMRDIINSDHVRFVRSVISHPSSKV